MANPTTIPSSYISNPYLFDIDPACRMGCVDHFMEVVSRITPEEFFYVSNKKPGAVNEHGLISLGQSFILLITFGIAFFLI